jgi:hypothetical protein
MPQTSMTPAAHAAASDPDPFATGASLDPLDASGTPGDPGWDENPQPARINSVVQRRMIPAIVSTSDTWQL